MNESSSPSSSSSSIKNKKSHNEHTFPNHFRMGKKKWGEGNVDDDDLEFIPIWILILLSFSQEKNKKLKRQS